MEPVRHRDLTELVRLSPAALLLLDRAGQVLLVNPAAAPLLGGQAMLSVKDGMLCARRKAEEKGLREALAALSAEAPAGLVCLRSREGVPVIVVDLLLLGGACVAAKVTDLAARPVPRAERLRRIFGLTPAEARVAAAMLTGLGLGAIARNHGVEPETVRTQAKRIRSKAGARSQNQLLGILTAIGEDFV